MAPATPTGLMVSETTETSITWTWDAVEGALGYVVQANMDEMWDDSDTVLFDGAPFTTMATYTAMDLEPETSVSVRVAAAAGSLEAPLVSAFTTHVTGMSAMPPPPPPPPAPDPVMVTFSLSEDADSPHFMVADDDDDEATAMASVNTEIMVESNSTAVITPMFVDGATGVSVDAMAGNTPFSYVSWGMMQSAVLSDGATFMVQRTAVGANQEMEPTGDVMYITCGPFECMEGSDAPELSIANSAVCTAWDPSVGIMVGKVDNDVIGPDSTDDADAADGVDTNDGVDLAIVTSSTLEMSVKHIFSGVANGTNTSKSVDADKGSNKTLAMAAVASIAVSEDENDDGMISVDETVCNNPYTSEDVSQKADRPGGLSGCFRLMGPGAGRIDNDASKGADYLSGWSIELSPKDADVMWGRVDWDDDPFEDLECGDADPIMVADHVDICEMFDAEVDRATGKGWKPDVVFGSEVPGFDATATDGSNTNPNSVVMWKATASAGSGEKMFKTIWFDDNLDGAILEKNPDPRPEQRNADDSGNVAGDTLNDLYNQNGRASNINAIWEFLTDDDGDLVASAGDLGKVDMLSDKDDPKTVDDETSIEVEECGTDGHEWRLSYDDDGDGEADEYTCSNPDDGVVTTETAAEDTTATATHPDGRADNYAASNDDYSDFRKCSEDDGGDDDDGSICDADWTRDAEIVFADGTFGCSTTRMVSITCTWDADGGMAQGRNALPPSFSAADKKNFLKCEAN